MHFGEALEWLCSFQFHGIKPGLERINRLLVRLGSPQKKFPSIHVAGTNGKGSTCAILAQILQACGYKVGLYTSPHLISIRERFLINQKPISSSKFSLLIEKIKNSAQGIPLTYFEITTALAFLFFAEESVDIAVIETGLGGRLDATNVLKPLLSVITNVGKDHQKYLGNTLKEIAQEKAGIIKTFTPVIVGKLKKEALKVIFQTIKKKKAPLFLYQRDFKISFRKGLYYYKGDRNLSELQLSLKGIYQKENLALALKALEIVFPHFRETQIRKALMEVSWPGRFEIWKKPFVILDGAHNLEGIKALIKALKKEKIYKYNLLFGVSDEGNDKPYIRMLKLLLPGAKKIFISSPPGPRKPVKLDSWRKVLKEENFPSISLIEDLSKALKVLIQEKEPLLVTGSLYLVGAVRKELLKLKNSGNFS